jgi:hypothetical protein
MEKLFLLLAFNVLWIVPSPDARVEAAPRVAPPGLQQILPAPVVPEDKGGRVPGDIIRWVTVEINGTLGHDNDPSLPIEEYDHWTGYSITADGKWYAVEFSDKDHEGKAKDLVGKRVRITGTLADRKMDGLIPHSIKLITATEFGEAARAKEEITIALTGKLEVKAMITYLYTEPVITVNGQAYVIDYEGAEGVFADARKLDGKMVVLTGRLAGERSFPVMCRPENVTLPVIQLTGVKAAEEKAKESIALSIVGKLERVPLDPIDPWMNVLGHPTGWEVHTGDRTYAVSFPNDAMWKLADKFDGRLVRLTGALEKHARSFRFELDAAAPFRWEIEILRLSELKAAEMDSVIETVHLEVEGDLEMINLMGPPPGEGWMVKNGEQTFHLQFSPDLPKEKPAQLMGKKVVVTGTRLDDLTILVTGLRLAIER